MVYFQIDLKKEKTNPEEMEVKDELVFYGMTWEEADNNKNNRIGAFQTRYSNTSGYYIVQWTGNEYTLQE